MVNSKIRNRFSQSETAHSLLTIHYSQNSYLASPNFKTWPKKKTTPSLFTKENYKWMLGGLVLMAIGMFLMTGGKSNDPAVFDKNTVYSTTRTTIAPVLILGGLVIEIFAIFRNPKTN